MGVQRWMSWLSVARWGGARAALRLGAVLLFVAALSASLSLAEDRSPDAGTTTTAASAALGDSASAAQGDATATAPAVASEPLPRTTSDDAASPAAPALKITRDWPAMPWGVDGAFVGRSGGSIVVVGEAAVLPALSADEARRSAWRTLSGDADAQAGDARAEDGPTDLARSADSRSANAPLANTPSVDARPVNASLGDNKSVDAPTIDTRTVQARWGAVAQVGDEIWCIGGEIGGVPTDNVRVVTWTGERLVIRAVAPLPMAVAQAGAVEVGGKVYVFGGRLPDGSASSRLWRMDAGGQGGWEELPPLPETPASIASARGTGRYGAIVTASFGQVHVFGGRVRLADGSWAQTTEAWSYLPRPVDGTMRRGWVRRSDMPMAVRGGGAFQSGQAHSLVMGGVGPGDAGEEAEMPLLAFHAVTDTWATVGPPAGVKGGRVLGLDKRAVVVGGVDADGEQRAVAEVALLRRARSLSWQDYLTITLYFAGMAAIGVYFASRQKSSEEFSLGNRNVVWWAGAFSMYATGTSAISLMAIPVMAYTSSLVFLTPVVLTIPLVILQAHVLMPMMRRLELTSTYEYLERRFNPTLRMLGSGQAIALQTFGRMSVVLLLPSLAVSATTGLSVYASILLMGVLTTAYTAVGGFEAVIWTDVAQGVLMLIGPLLMIGIALWAVPGGVTEIWQTSLTYDKFTPFLATWDWTVPAIWISLLGVTLGATGFAGDQPMVQRVFATPLKDVRRMQYMTCALGVTIAVIVTSVGLSLFHYFRARPGDLDPGMANDQIVPLFLVQAMPAGLAGLLVSAIFAASMSTMSSSMNSVATLVSEDFYKRFFPGASDSRRLILMKGVSFLVGAIGIGVALLMATYDIRSMFESWNRIAALLGGGFVGVYTLGMFTTRANGVGAICGAVASVVWTLWAEHSGMHWTLLGPSATLACIVVGYAVSLFTGRPSASLEGLTVFTLGRSRDEPLKSSPAVAVA